MSEDTTAFDYSRFEKVVCPDGQVDIPAPTEEDKQWAVDLHHEFTEAKARDDHENSNSRYSMYRSNNAERVQKIGKRDAFKSNSLWRVQYAIQFLKDAYLETSDFSYGIKADNADLIELLIANGANPYSYIREYGSEEYRRYMIRYTDEHCPLWNQQSEKSISKTDYEVHDQGILHAHRTTFNFEAQRISKSTTIGDHLKIHDNEWFHEQATDREIVAAYNALSAKGVKLAPIEDYTSKAYVADKGVKATPMPKLQVKAGGAS